MTNSACDHTAFMDELEEVVQSALKEARAEAAAYRAPGAYRAPSAIHSLNTRTAPQDATETSSSANTQNDDG